MLTPTPNLAEDVHEYAEAVRDPQRAVEGVRILPRLGVESSVVEGAHLVKVRVRVYG